MKILIVSIEFGKATSITLEKKVKPIIVKFKSGKFCQHFHNAKLKSWTNSKRKPAEQLFKGCVRYIFASLFLCLKENTCETRKNAFYFTSKALLVLEIIKF